MNFLKNYLKCIAQRWLLILVFIIAGIGVSCGIIYSFYNPSHEYYELTFTYTTTEYDLSDLKKTSYVKNVKDEINSIRRDGEYIILNDYKYMKDDGYICTNYTDSKGYNHFKITDKDSNVVKDEYGIFDFIKDGYIYLDDWYYYTNGCDVSYKDGIITIDNDGEEITLVAKWDKKYNYSYSSFEYIKSKKIANTTKYHINSDSSITLKCQQRYFNSWQQARRFMMRMVNNLNAEKAKFQRGSEMVTSDSKSVMNESVINTSGGVKILPYASIGAGIGALMAFATLFVLVAVKKEEAVDHLNYDNDRIYKYPFHISYWRKSIKELNSIKKLTMLAMLFAMMQVVRLIPLPSGFGNLGLSISLIFFVVIGMLYGPVIGFAVGAISDVFGFFVFPDGYPFHIGYTLQAALTGFTYGICFYKTKVNFTKALFARLIVNIFLNAMLGSIFWGDVASLSGEATKTYFLTLSLPKNIAYLIPQSILIYLVFKALAPALKAMGLIDPEIADDIAIHKIDINLND